MLAGPAAALVAGWLLVASGAPLQAQEAARPRLPEVLAPPEIGPLPKARRTDHVISRAGRALRFAATAGALAIGGLDGEVLADVAYTAYLADSANPAQRPIVFAFNGGPGSASTWLHLGALGPWRVPLTAETIAGLAAAEPIGNDETWLDFADLVFIDPPGTGYSRIWPSGQAHVYAMAGSAYGEPIRPRMTGTGRRVERGAARGQPSRLTGGPEWFWSLEGDIATFVEFIAAWLERHDRKGSPVVLAGESYGGFRAPPIAEALAEAHGISVAAMLLVSPVLDFDGRRGWRTPVHYAALLPSLAATRIERTGGVPGRALLAEAEGYAGGEFIADLMRGPRDLAAVQRLAHKVGALSGVGQEALRLSAGRLTIRGFVEGSPDLRGSVVSIYDVGMTGLAPVRGGARGGFADPFTAGLDQPLTAAMGVLHGRLDWCPERTYTMLSGEVNRRWRWPNSPHPPQVLAALADLHRKDPRLRTLVMHGYTDLVTPYFASVLQLEQLPEGGAAQRIGLEVYAGGHMFYSRDDSRVRFRADAARIIGEAVGARTKKPPGDQRETP